MLETNKNGCTLRVRLTPKASKNALQGVEQNSEGKTHLKVMVTAVPEKGKANAALIKLLAGKLGLPKTGIRLIAGETSRQKTLQIEGLPEELYEYLHARLHSLGLTG